MDPRRPNHLPVTDMYGDEGMASGRSLGDPRLALHRSAEIAPLQRHRSGIDLSQPVDFRDMILTRQQSEGGKWVFFLWRFRHFMKLMGMSIGGSLSRRDLARRNVPTLGRERALRRSRGSTLSRSQTEIRLPRDSSIVITRSRSRSPLRWSAVSRQNSSTAASETPSEPSSWRRFSSSLARMLGRSSSENNSRPSTDCFQDNVESLASSQSSANAAVAAAAASSSQAVEEATIPNSQSSPMAAAETTPADRSEEEDPDPLLWCVWRV